MITLNKILALKPNIIAFGCESEEIIKSIIVKCSETRGYKPTSGAKTTLPNLSTRELLACHWVRLQIAPNNSDDPIIAYIKSLPGLYVYSPKHENPMILIDLLGMPVSDYWIPISPDTVMQSRTITL